MSLRDVIPRNNTHMAAWLLHFAAKIDAHASTVSAAADDIKALKADALMVEWIIKAAPSVRSSGQQFTSFKDDLLDGPTGGAPLAAPVAPSVSAPPPAVPTGVIPRTRGFMQRIKNAVGYTQAIGQDLGIVASVADLAADSTAKPAFRATAQPHSENRLDWVKGSHSGVLVQGRRPGEDGWSDLGRDNYSPYVDGRPPLKLGTSETREFRMRYFDKDTEVGEWSDVVSVVTIP